MLPPPAKISVPDGRSGLLWRHQMGLFPPMRMGHRHLEWEFNLVTRGSAAYVIGDRRVEIQTDSLLWLLPTQVHILVEYAEDFEMWVAVIRPHVIETFLNETGFELWREWTDTAEPPSVQHRRIGEDATRQLAALCQQVRQAEMNDKHANAGFNFLLAEAWSAYISAPDRPQGSHLHPAVQKAVDLIAQPREPGDDDIDRLAELCSLSRPHLSRLFKKQIGQTLTTFRNEQRVERFLARVGRGGRVNLTQAAYAAGFGSYAQAYRVIREVTGQSPREILGK